jgi:undecaprenyl diphosphate synthase
MQNSLHIPQHIAIVMDGNGRWAKKRHLPRLAGHKQGVEALRDVITSCHDLGVKALTVFAFSSENWKRPQEEVSGIIELMGLALSREVPRLKAKGVRMHFIGEKAGLSERLKKSFAAASAETAGGTAMDFNICFNYGGRWDMAQAAAQVAAKGWALTPENIDRHMALAHVPDPDLLIRTGGETRISNFLLWQAAYSELYFSDKLWPEFDHAALLDAIGNFSRRERRFGQTSEQVKPA